MQGKDLVKMKNTPSNKSKVFVYMLYVDSHIDNQQYTREVPGFCSEEGKCLKLAKRTRRPTCLLV